MKRIFVIVTLVCAGVLGGCTYNVRQGAQHEDDPGAVQVTDDLFIDMPAPTDLGRTLEVSQLVTAHFGENTVAFEAHISATPDHFHLVGLDLTGRKAMTIDWTKDHIVYDAAPWISKQLKPETVLADLVLLYWPEQSVARSVRLSGGKLFVTPTSRLIHIGATDAISISYEPHTPGDLWSGPAHFHNTAAHYDIDIQSTETAP